MKTIFIFISTFLFFAFCINAQDNYKVIKVNGTIVVQKTNAALQMGTVFGEDDELQFKTTNARAAVINPNKGRFVLMPSNNDVAYAKANLTPAMSNISSRAGAMISRIDIENHFSGKYAILDKVEVKINPSLFPMTDSKFFFIRYDYKGETINKKLPFVADTLIIDKKELLTIDGQPIPNPNITKMEILYMETDDNNKRTLISEFDPIFLDGDELIGEVKIILDEIADKTREEKLDEVIAYITEFYGKPNKENIEQWLDKNSML